MKIIRPEQPIKKEITLEDVLIYQAEKEEEELIDDNTGIEIVEPTPVPVQVDLTIENLMDEIIKQKDDKIQVKISLTKRQYDLYLKKGSEGWLKKALTSVKTSKKKKK